MGSGHRIRQVKVEIQFDFVEDKRHYGHNIHCMTDAGPNVGSNNLDL